MARDVFAYTVFVDLGRLVLQLHRALDRGKLAQRDFPRPMLNSCFERLAGHERVDQFAIEGLGRVPQLTELDVAGALALLELRYALLRYLQARAKSRAVEPLAGSMPSHPGRQNSLFSGRFGLLGVRVLVRGVKPGPGVT